MIEVEVLSSSISDIDVDAVLTGVFEGDSPEVLYSTDEKLKNMVTNLFIDGEINGKLATTSLIHSRGEIKPKRILIVGLGKKNELSLDRLRGMAAVSGRLLRDINCRKIGIHLGFLPRNFRYKDSSMAVIEGFLLGQYSFDKYRYKDKKTYLERFGIYFPEEVDFDAILLSKAIRTGAYIAKATNLSRDLCNEPGNILTPVKLSELALKLGEEYGLIVKILDEKEMEKLGMNLLLAVGRGSVEPVRLIILEYHGGGHDKPLYGLLGKGVTFDSGGVSLKDRSSMSHMHLDKTAGAVVIGILTALATLKVKINIAGIIPAVENMPAGNAYKPGDIIKSMSGKTVEVTNTDAEGRLIMADSLTYMQSILNIKYIVDFATLTGGSKAALGSDIIPVFSNDRHMVKLFKEACWHSGELCWQMPLYKNYLKLLKSHVADLKNHSKDPPSTIAGALFLNEFVEHDTRWMHIDIGGHEFREEEFSYLPCGATALGMRSLIRFYLHVAGEDIGKDSEECEE
ncbi:MAG TPA: leucyl aminopeptidase [Candidatus Eremiobacteraeota bacterium]|nr:MAG: putative cytosol aminopeptidase [bacterium ADurb.Bin363]HPZ09602.1 leucyl aminopeptidase [Candidatus Eremiobacteraeota bacterium]